MYNMIIYTILLVVGSFNHVGRYSKSRHIRDTPTYSIIILYYTVQVRFPGNPQERTYRYIANILILWCFVHVSFKTFISGQKVI